MITITQKNPIIKDAEKNVLFYPDLFAGPIIDNIYNEIDDIVVSSLSVGLAVATEKIFKPKRTINQSGSLACIILKDENLVFTKDKEKIEIPCRAGSVVILGAIFRKEWTYELPELSIKLYDDNYLPMIYRSTKQRILYGKKVKKTLLKLKEFPTWKQCPQKSMNLVLLGKGSYGNVYKGGFMSEVFALKMAKLKPEAIKHPYDYSLSSWHEVYFMKYIFKDLIKNNKCQNLPLLYDAFTCGNCELSFDGEKYLSPCVITVVELASGNLKEYLEKKRTTEEILSCIFQVMAGIHAIQYFAQIMNFDVKKENVIFYDIEPGGYWLYKIRGKNYYVPNHGKLFILNDFGISRPMSPKYPMYKTKEEKTFRLGSRYAVIKDDKFVPFDTLNQKTSNTEENKAIKLNWYSNDSNGKQMKSLGAEFRMLRKDNSILELPVKIPEDIQSYLKGLGIPVDPIDPEFFMYPEIIPPFEFYNDTQDAIRMFTGGKRTTQRGYHKYFDNIPKNVIKKLREYLGNGESAKDGEFSYDPAQVLGGYFIESFFKNYLTKPENDEIIGTFTISI